MKSILPYVALICGLVLGWTMKGVLEPSNGGNTGKLSTSSSTTLGSASGPGGTGSITVSQNIVLTPGTPKEELQKITLGILRDPNYRHRMRSFLNLVDGMTEDNVGAIREMFATLPRKDILSWDQFQGFFFQRWGEIAGEEAVRAALEGIPGEVNGDLNVKATLYGWAQRDMEGALKFAQGLPAGSKERQLANVVLTKILMKADLDRAAEFALSQPEGSEGEPLKLIIEEAQYQERPDLLQKWFERAPDGPAKGTLALKTVDSLRSKSIDEAVEFLSNVGDAPWRNWELYWKTAGDYAKRDPKAALDWVFTLPLFPNESAPPGLSAVLGQWHAQQPDAANSWLLQNADQPWWPRAAKGILEELRRSGNKQAAETFLNQFTPEGRQMIEEDLKKGTPAMRKKPAN